MLAKTVQTPEVTNHEFKIYDRKSHCPKENCHHKGVYYLGTDFISLPPRVQAVHHYTCAQMACKHTWTTLAN